MVYFNDVNESLEEIFKYIMKAKKFFFKENILEWWLYIKSFSKLRVYFRYNFYFNLNK